MKNMFLRIINWNSVATALAVSVASFLAVEGYVVRNKAYFASEQAEQNRKTYEDELKPLLQDIAKNVDKLSLILHTVVGPAAILSGGSDEDYILINESSDAGMYADDTKVRVTNISSEVKPSMVLKITGTFSNGTYGNAIIALSKHAAEKLEMISNDGNKHQVKLEPAQ